MDAASLRGTAREIGTSAAVLSAFLGGARPALPTVRKLLDWQVREHARLRTPPPPEIARAALEALLRHLPPARQRSAARRILGAVERRGPGPGIPPWLDHLREGFPDGE